MSTGSHPLTPTRRIGQVISISWTPAPTVEVAIGGDTSTTVFVPFLDSYAPAVNDYVALLGTQGDYVCIGRIATGPRVTVVTAPSATTDYTTVGVTACSVAVNVLSGRNYLVVGTYLGGWITSTGSFTFQIRAAGVELARNAPSVSYAVSAVTGGGVSAVYTATSTTSVTFTSSGISSGGALRSTANQWQLSIIDEGI